MTLLMLAITKMTSKLRTAKMNNDLAQETAASSVTRSLCNSLRARQSRLVLGLVTAMEDRAL